MSERITRADVAQYKRELLDQTVLVAPAEASQILACSERTVHRLVRDGEIHAYRSSTRLRGLRLLASELRDYVHSLKIDKERWRE